MSIVRSLFDLNQWLSQATTDVTSVSAAVNAFLQSKPYMQKKMVGDFPELLKRLQRAGMVLDKALNTVALESGYNTNNSDSEDCCGNQGN